MTKKIFSSVFFTSLIIFTACVIMITGAFYQYLDSIELTYLKNEMYAASQGVEKSGYSYFEGFSSSDFRLTLIASDGTVLKDTKADPATMENHSGREEVQEAIKSGAGESYRYSATLQEKTIYYAQRLSDGSILRISVTQYTVTALVIGILPVFAFILLVALILSIFIATKLSNKIVAPLNKIDLDHPLENNTYDELAPLLTKIDKQQKQLSDQYEILEQKQDEFTAVTDNMAEGLILLNDKGTILSMNNSSKKIFDIKPDLKGRDFLTITHELSVQNIVKTALSGKSDQTTIHVDKLSYQIEANPIISNGKVIGAVILAYDVTTKINAENMRKEFSANVSHELRTPLQSIMGSAELIKNNMVKIEDLPRFADRIYTESTRMVSLIDDIIRLSKLDEDSDYPNESVNLYSISESVISSLSNAAEKMNIAVTLSGDNISVTSVKQLVYDIIYNLCDNAIKYNHKDGKVDVIINNENGNASVTVSDTGIGIPKEYQQRIFERFFRVDKSHSKETGGTGLGLSIVKHACSYVGASIDLSSEPEKGTLVKVIFKDISNK
jgi:two-component system phosphate regulon sensor histidine kinase PhoR